MKNFIIVLKNHNKSEYFSKIAIFSAATNNWNLEVFDAIDGRTVGQELFKKEGLFVHPIRKIKRSFARPGVVGCFLSHYILWKQCVSLGEPIGIFEEDVIFLKPPTSNFYFKDVLKLEVTLEGKTYSTGRWWSGAYAYMITPVAAAKLIGWVHSYGAMPADVMLGTDLVNIEFDTNNLVTLNIDSLANNNALSTTTHQKF